MFMNLFLNRKGIIFKHNEQLGKQENNYRNIHHHCIFRYLYIFRLEIIKLNLCKDSNKSSIMLLKVTLKTKEKNRERLKKSNKTF